MESFEQLQQAVEAAKADADKFFNQGNKAAGTRLRVAMQEIKRIAQDVREDVHNRRSLEQA